MMTSRSTPRIGEKKKGRNAGFLVAFQCGPSQVRLLLLLFLLLLSLVTDPPAMASERTQCRRKRCLFRRAFCRFRTCQRKPRAGCPGAYEIGADSSQDLVGRWVSLDTIPGEVDSQRAPHDKMDACLDESRDARTESPLTAGHQLNGMGGLAEDSLHLYLNRMGTPFMGADLSSVSLPQVPVVAIPHPRASWPPSPSESSMEMDLAADVDPETGERAMG
ncbi:uncharacterized protein LOC115078156 [Rhinatrema bivittatum]|uniref:uncharacterized protein LOC115078156 n=1 Tax=Rhinatrema bivittatum TaxID=194408 RepID=UPI00112C8388|nr:uncharacterized protein LOC115078156 [Rhinatrema bivittatum]